MEFCGKKVLVFGTGISGIGAADLLTQQGAEVILYDGNENVDKDGVRARLKAPEKTDCCKAWLPCRWRCRWRQARGSPRRSEEGKCSCHRL